MNLCEAELSKNMDDIVIHRLASLLEIALRLSTADFDPYKDDLKPELLPYDLQYQMFRILLIQTREEKGIMRICYNLFYFNNLNDSIMYVVSSNKIYEHAAVCLFY